MAIGEMNLKLYRGADKTWLAEVGMGSWRRRFRYRLNQPWSDGTDYIQWEPADMSFYIKPLEGELRRWAGKEESDYILRRVEDGYWCEVPVPTE